MMTNEQALDMLRRAIDPLQDAVDNVALYVAFDALEKQIPMKMYGPNGTRCPNCGTALYDESPCGNEYYFCPNCGQRIEWGEMNDDY